VPRLVDADQRRAELTAITAREIARVGLERVTLRDIARVGGWSTGIVSHYFADKRELLLATFRSRADLAARRAAEGIAAGASALQAFVEAVLPTDDERMLNWQVWLAFWGAAVGDGALTAAQRERYALFHASLEAALQAELSAGRVRADLDLGYEARRLVTVLDGIAVQAVFEADRFPPAEQRRVVADHLATLAPPPAPSRRRPATA